MDFSYLSSPLLKRIEQLVQSYGGHLEKAHIKIKDVYVIFSKRWCH